MANKKETIVAVSGYFNPLHLGHIKMFKEAKELGDRLIVIINNDKQVKLKGSVPFMNQKQRSDIVSYIKYVDDVFISIDTDRSVCKSLKQIWPDVFANGGDRKTVKDILEAKVCKDLDIRMVFGVGGKKICSSSKFIKKAKNHEV